MGLEVPILQTYVDGLDRVLGGGIPKGSTVLVAGTPGTMKTSLILWMMHENARAHGTKSLYVSLEQDMDSLKAGAARMGMATCTSPPCTSWTWASSAAGCTGPRGRRTGSRSSSRS